MISHCLRVNDFSFDSTFNLQLSATLTENDTWYDLLCRQRRIPPFVFRDFWTKYQPIAIASSLSAWLYLSKSRIIFAIENTSNYPLFVIIVEKNKSQSNMPRQLEADFSPLRITEKCTHKFFDFNNNDHVRLAIFAITTRVYSYYTGWKAHAGNSVSANILQSHVYSAINKWSNFSTISYS